MVKESRQCSLSRHFISQDVRAE